MNYFTQVAHFFDLVEKDSRLTPFHISIYWALLHVWNKKHFAESFLISKNEILCLSKIGSEHTYYKRVSELHNWNYFECIPGKNGVVKCKFKLFEFSEQLIAQILESDVFFDSALQICSTAIVDTVELQKCSSTTAIMQQQDCNNASILIRQKRLIRHKDSLEQNHLNDAFKIKEEQRKKVPAKKERNFNSIPNENEIEEFFISNNATKEMGQKFFLYYSETGWVNKNNCPITNWQAAAKRWILNEFPSNTINLTKQVKSKNDRNYDKPF
jgi:hypothetical protein